MFLAGDNNLEEYNIKKEDSPEYLEEHFEYLEDVKKELTFNSLQIVFENGTAKCGEVMVGYEGEFTFICVLCRQPFHDLPSFGNHIKEFHLNYSASTEVSTEKNNRDPPCEEDIASSVSSQQEVKLESPRNSSVSSRNASESSRFASISIQNELDIEILETAASSHCSDNISKDGNSNCDESIPVEASTESSKVREFACTLCGRIYKILSSYRRHMRKRHPNGVPDQIICKYCSKEFENLMQLEAHLRTHKGRKKYVCPQCPKLFNNDLSRQVHINVHNGERPYKCPHCPAAFADPRVCKRHKREQHAAADLSESEPESSASAPQSIPDPIRKGPEVIFVDAAISSDGKDNEESVDDVSNCAGSTPVATSSNSAQVGKFGCPFCGRSYQALSSYKRHVKKWHSNGVPDKIVCKFCHEEFEDLIQLETHVRTHTGQKRYICKLCPKAFSSSYNRQLHTKVHTGKRPYKCILCSSTFTDSYSWEKHKSEHHQVKNENDSKLELEVAASLNNEDNKDLADVVSNCEQKSSDSSKVEEIVCTECGRTYRTKSSYIAHMKKKHTGLCESPPDETICQYCDKEFENAEELRAHVGTHTGRKRFVCPFCPKAFDHRKQREYHVNTHTGERPYKCSLCPKKFAHPNNLVKHEYVHLKIMRYSCDYCDRRFVQKSSKKVHERTHTGEKPFQCEECGQRFMSHVRMTEHFKRHKNIKPNICTVCNKGFYNSNQLKNHMPIHTGERPFQCKFCGKSYPRKKSLRSHLQLHTNDKKYVCNLCGEAFLQSTGLYTHRKTHGENL